MKYLALFFTTSGSVKFKRKLGRANIPAEAIPVPRKLSSGCGIAIEFTFKDDPMIFIDDSIQRLYRIEGESFITTYSAE